ncbi:hypothetical protein H6F43_06210 [Leptolyngbya sp. FACHB-36]|uniref:hypothetical protein n=1 Tax=Leptolyngbya sp. FACHB-36 TaxID=2692808 RepID=UPI0016804E1A|nr:hypothetical protein [Leptolyngbya sp. FACHB-36]MBD2019780.1 hypothetical protein [Leptolyngbya sp. FACHB-36]
MTFPKDQIQALIAEIDGVLQKTTPRLPWVMSGEATQQRRVLERVRNYLVAQQRRMVVENSGQPRPDLLAHDVQYPTAQSPYLSAAQDYGSSETNAQQMLQAVVQEMGYLRSGVMQPLVAELDALRHQKDTLLQEIRQLEGQRQSYVAAAQLPNQQQMIAEFLQVLMSRLQESLPQQMAQSLQGVSNPSLPYSDRLAELPAAIEQPYSDSVTNTSLSSSDQLVVNLDGTLRIVFEALQRDIKAYQESLAQGLDRMHSLGLQGEMMFSALINHLAQAAGREASSYLQGSGQLSELEPATPPAEPETAQTDDRALTAVPTESVPANRSDDLAANLEFPYAGIELSPTPSRVDLSDLTRSEADDRSAPLPSTEITDIDAALKLLEQLNAPYQETVAPADAEAQLNQILSDTAPGASASVGGSVEAASDDLDEFYESLFGTGTIAPTADNASETEEPVTDSLQGWDTVPLAASEPPADSGEATMEADVFSDLFAEIEPDSIAAPASSSADLPTLLIEPDAPMETADSMSRFDLVEAQPDEIRSLTDLFEDEPMPVAANTEPLPPASSIDDALTLEAFGQALGAAEEPPQSPRADATPDLYVPASPDENLLPSNDVGEGPMPVWLDESTLSSLSEDLSSLEDAGQASVDDLNFLDWSLNSADVPDLNLHADLVDSSLEDAAAAIPATNQDAGSTFTLEGMDDLFADVPSPDLRVDRADSSPEDVATTNQDAGPTFTLEGMDDLFADVPSPDLRVDRADPSPEDVATTNQDAGPTFTLEGMDDLFADVPSTNAPSSDPVAPLTSESAAFTLEGMDDLFTDVPAVAAIPVPPPATPAEPVDSANSALTLEGLNDLFGDAPETEVAAPDVPADSIEVLVDSTPDSPPAEPLVVPVVNPLPSDSSNFTIERMGDLFVEVPTAAATGVAESAPDENQSAFRLEHRGGVFVEIPVGSPASVSQTQERSS